MQCAAEIISDIVLSVRKSTCAAESSHDRACLALDAGLYLLAVYRALALLERLSCLEYCHLKTGSFLCELIRREYSSGTCPDDNNVILIHFSYLP